MTPVVPRSHVPARVSSPLRLAVLAVVLLLAAAAIAACGGGEPATTVDSASGDGPGSPVATSAPEVTDVTLIMDWVPWVLDIPVDVAQENGFYAEHGLKVKQVLPAGPTDVVKFVSTGKAQFGLYYAPDTLMGVAEGAPLVSVAALMGHAPLGMALAPGVRADSPADLEGTTAGVVLVPSTRASFQTMLTTAGADPSTVKVADPGFEIVPPLLAGKYDWAAVTEFGELVQAEATGQELDYLDFRDWGVPDYAFLNVVSEQGFAGENPATVRAFVAATMEGLDWAVTHPEEAVDLYVRRHPELKRELLLAQWRAALPSMASTTAGRPAGIQDPAAWRELSDWMVETQLISEPVDIARVVTNDHLPVQ